MIPIAQSLLLFFLLGVNSIGPGVLALRRVRLKPQELFCAAVGLSQFIAYLIAFGLYLIHAPNICYWLITVVGIVCTVIAQEDLRSLWKSALVRAQVKAFFWMLVIGFCMLALIRHYSGGLWAGDWIEHYDRSLFFLEHHAYGEMFVDKTYSLPARPPMMNVLAAGYMAQLGDNGFSIFSRIFLFLNLLPILPCVLFLPMFGIRRLRASLASLLFLLATSPMFMENVTWTWTKLMAAFFVLLGLYLYLRGSHKSDSTRTIGAFVCLAIGMLVHYSAGPYILVIALHYLVVLVLRTPKRWKEPVIAAGASAVVLMIWVVWSLAIYGFKGTFASNTTVADSSHLTFGGNVVKILKNFEYTFVPHPFTFERGAYAENFAQESAIGYVRDYLFPIYQQNIIFMLGSVGGLLVLVQVVRFLIVRKMLPVSEKIFWWWFILGTTVVGIASHGTMEVLGVAQVVHQSLILLGIVFFAAGVMTFPRWVRVVLVIACLVDFSLGVFLQATLEHRDYIRVPVPVSPGNIVMYPTGAGLNIRAARNWNAKDTEHLHFLGDDFQHAGALLQIIFTELIALLTFRMWRYNITDKPPPSRRRSLRELLPRSHFEPAVT